MALEQQPIEPASNRPTEHFSNAEFISTWPLFEWIDSVDLKQLCAKDQLSLMAVALNQGQLDKTQTNGLEGDEQLVPRLFPD